MAATMPTVYAHSHVAMPIATRLTRRIALYDNTTATLFSGLFLLTSGLGYNDVRSFIRFFKKFTGLTPKDFRRQNLPETGSNSTDDGKDSD